MVIVTCDICNKEIGRHECLYDVRESRYTKTYADPLNRATCAFYCCDNCWETAKKEFDERLEKAAQRLEEAIKEYDDRLEKVLFKDKIQKEGTNYREMYLDD